MYYEFDFNGIDIGRLSKNTSKNLT